MKRHSSYITPQQVKVLNSLVCERLSKSKANFKLLQSFEQPHSDKIGVLDYAKSYAEKKDAKNTEAYYIVRTKSGVGLFFFSLESGCLFRPYMDMNAPGVDMTLTLFAKKVKSMLETSVDDSILKEELKELLTKKLSPKAFIDELSKKYKLKDEDKKSLEEEQKKEKNKLIFRVHSIHSGIHLNLLCRNDSAEANAVWDSFQLGTERPKGEIIFWWFIVPLMIKARKLIGAEYAFLFAADDTEDETLVKYYKQSFGFDYKPDVGVNKPYWDWTCVFLCKDLCELKKDRTRFRRIFNSLTPMFDSCS